MITAGEQPQALRRLVEQFRFRQNAPADGDRRVSGKDVGAFEFVIDAHHAERGFRLGTCEPRGIGARQLAAFWGLVDVGGPQCVGFDPDLINEREPAWRAGSENQFWTADHLNR